MEGNKHASDKKGELRPEEIRNGFNDRFFICFHVHFTLRLLLML